MPLFYKTVAIILIGILISAAIIIMKKHFSYQSTPPGTIIIVNGPSAVGKSSIIKAFQTKQSTPWLNIGIDNFFVGVLPSKYYLEDKPEHHSVMQGISSYDNQHKVFTLHVGPAGYNVIEGMHRAIAAYAKAGNNVIVDYIMYDPCWYQDLQQSLKGLTVIKVGVSAKLSILEEREKKRGTSPQGHARSMYYTVHQGWDYDLEINTDSISPEKTADIIINLLKNK